MVQATQFFDRPARGMCQIYSQMFGMFFDELKTFAILALLQSLVFIPVFFIFFIIAVAAFGSELAVLSQTMNNGVRRLYESAGYDSSSTNWDDASATSSYQTSDGILPPGFVFLIAYIMGLYVAFLATAICISASFQGAFIRAVGEIFAGRSPHWQNVLSIGWKKACSIICFGFLCLAGVVVAGGIWFGTTIFLFSLGQDQPSFAAIFFSILFFVAAYIAFSCSMTGGVTSIMVENQSALAAVGRSWNLCESSICFIFCCVFCFYILEILGQICVKKLLFAVFSAGRSDPTTTALIMGAANWIMALLLGPLNATLNPVIYFSLRIQKEGLTMEELQSDLSLLEDSIELRTGDGIYSKVGIEGKFDPSLIAPIANATAV